MPIHWSDYTHDSERGHAKGVPKAFDAARVPQVDAAHWWWLRRDPPHDYKSALGVQQYTIKRYINALFIHSFIPEGKLFCASSKQNVEVFLLNESAF